VRVCSGASSSSRGSGQPLAAVVQARHGGRVGRGHGGLVHRLDVLDAELEAVLVRQAELGRAQPQLGRSGDGPVHGVLSTVVQSYVLALRCADSRSAGGL
jgi:hypothetical protein